jgi:Epoxide hydrolase N terminus
MGVTPFEVRVPQRTLDDLHNGLERIRWTDEIEDDSWDRGTNPSYLKELVEYWLTRFDWRQQEEAINRFAHFRADVDGFGVHFIHERGKGERPLPIVLTHGYPDSFVRFLKIIPI